MKRLPGAGDFGPAGPGAASPGAAGSGAAGSGDVRPGVASRDAARPGAERPASLTPGPVVATNAARCRDCYRCVRVCPVKAIRLSRGQASVDPQRCLGCGTCIRECPQGAKTYRRDVERVTALLRAGRPVAASVAPSFAGVVERWEWGRLPSALRRLGFRWVAETAAGAGAVARRTAEWTASRPRQTCICSACPAVVRFVERCRPALVEHLAPVVSPMIAHARMLKSRLPVGSAVVFIGPCVAKKQEADRAELAGAVDAVLTFEELFEWLEREGIELAGCEESGFDVDPAGREAELAGGARLFPLEGGSLYAASLGVNRLSPGVVCAGGFEEMCDALDDSAAELVEPLFCPQGCINGAGIPRRGDLPLRRRRLLEYANGGGRPAPAFDLPAVRDGRDGAAAPELATRFFPEPAGGEEEIPEGRIREVLESTGKGRAEDQLNCGACGYASCRDQAAAVVRGMAEPEMCIPYMRRLAERRVDRIIETSPNGIVILDEDLKIIGMNPAFRRYFLCSEDLCGKSISCLMDPEMFERLASGREERIEAVVNHERYDLTTHQILYPLPEERQYVGIFVNVTSLKQDRVRLKEIREETILQARELYEHQVSLAQRMAQLLGEYTAQGEKLTENLLLLAGRGDEPPEGGREGRWPTRTWK